MASGVAIPDATKTAYTNDLKMDKKHRYVLYRLSDDVKEIIVDKRAPRDATFEDLSNDLSEAEQNKQCRWAVFDLDYTNDKGQPKTKIIMISWAPDTSKVKQKMVHASSQDAFRKALGEGISKNFQFSEMADLSTADIVKELNLLDKF